jgi:uncharacterized protein (DUF1330 family)
VELHNALMPDQAQLARLLGSEDPGPVVMVNLLRFRDRAVYPDGRATDLSGAEAFGLYGELMRPIVEGFGGRFLVSALLEDLVIGSGEMGWHRIALVEYPSRAVFRQVMTDPAVHAAAVHRAAGLEGQLLIASTLDADRLERRAAAPRAEAQVGEAG